MFEEIKADKTILSVLKKTSLESDFDDKLDAEIHRLIAENYSYEELLGRLAIANVIANAAVPAIINYKPALEKQIILHKSQAAQNSALKKLANDPKQKEKIIVKECWEAWQLKPKQYKNKTLFATAMVDKFKPENPDEDCKHLSSVKKITDWCRVWEREKVSPS